MAPRLTAGQRGRLEALRRAYVRDLPGKVRAIEEAAGALRPADRGKLRSLHHLVHRLTGSSAIYGFDRLSRAAAALEELVLAAGNETSSITLEEDAALAERLATLRAELAAVRGAGERPDRPAPRRRRLP